MKLSRKILPALAMLLVSAIMVTTASFAWFAMGTSVSVTGMQVGINSNSKFLLISEDSDIGAVRTGNKTNLDYSSVAKTNLYPVAHKDITNIAEADTAANWYYQESNDPTKPTASSGQLPIGTMTDYVYSKTVYVAASSESEDLQSLKATVTITGHEAVRVIVASETAIEEFSVSGAGTKELVTTISAADTNPHQIKIYIFYEGSNEKIYTDNIPNINDTKVDVTLSAT